MTSKVRETQTIPDDTPKYVGGKWYNSKIIKCVLVHVQLYPFMTKALEGGQVKAPAIFTSWKDPVPIVQAAGWAPGPVWTGAENLATTGIRSRTVRLVASRYTD